jgi:hypothetical protein
LVQEAGGVATACLGEDYDLSRGNYLAASTPELQQSLRSILASCSQ